VARRGSGLPTAKTARPVRWAAALAAVATGAFLLRLLVLVQLRHTLLFAVLIGDAQEFDTLARQIAGGRLAGSDVFYEAQFYPYLLALVFHLAGHHVFVVRIVQAVLGSAACAFLGLAGRAFLDERVGLIAAAALAIYPAAIFFDCIIQKSSLDLLLMTALLATLGAFLRRRDWRALVLSGVVMGLFTWNRENARVLVPVIALWLCFAFRDVAWRRRFAWLGLFAAGITIALMPVSIRNYVTSGELLISTSQLGANLYIGNHPGASGAYQAFVPDHGNAVFERADATLLAQQAAGRVLSPGEVSSYWTGRALDYIRAQPGAWLRLMARKLLLTFGAREVTDTESLEAYADYSSVLALLQWFGFGVVLPLAVFGAWVRRADWRRWWLLPAIVVSFGFAVTLFFVLARYRFPIVPVVMLFAAAGIAALLDWRQADRRRWTPGLIAAVVVALPVNLTLRSQDDQTFLNVGTELIRGGRPGDAIPLLEKAIALSPDDAPPHFNLGIALNATGNKAQAIAEFTNAVRLWPDYFEAHRALALTLREVGRASEARTHFEAAVRLNPDSAGAHTNLGNALMEAGVPGRAILEYEAAVRLRPEDAAAHAGLALALGATGQHDRAMTEFTEALRLQPEAVGTRVSYGDLLMTVGRVTEAVAQYEVASTSAPESVGVRHRLAQAYGRAGRLTDALATLEGMLATVKASGPEAAVPQIEQAIREIKTRIKSRMPGS
jgi:tetratricopeptide (TPR) repeat protein